MSTPNRLPTRGAGDPENRGAFYVLCRIITQSKPAGICQRSASILPTRHLAYPPPCLPAILPTRRLAYPPRLRERLRSTNLLERSLGEVKRRTKIIGRFPGETSCLRLCWAVMDLVITAGRGLPRPHRFRAPTVRPDPRRPGHPITPRDDRVRCSHCAEKRLHFTAARGRDRAARGHLANDTS